MCFKYFVYYYNEMKEDMLTAQGILVETDLLACVKALQDYYGENNLEKIHIDILSSYNIIEFCDDGRDDLELLESVCKMIEDTVIW